MAKGDVVKSTLTQTKWHRRCIGDVVAMNHGDHNSDLSENDEGTITGIVNEEGTYIEVDFGDKGTHVLTEDDVHRVG